MTLTEMIADIRTELADATTFWSTAELTRAVKKTVSLMSRLIPKRVIIETVLDRDITGETLTIASNTGTLTYKPVKVGSLAIPSMTENTHYTVNHLTGVVTEVGSGLPDAAYTVAYDLDPYMLDISTLLPEEDYIRIEGVEYTAGDEPATRLVFDIFGEFLLIKSKDYSLTSDKYLRIIYLKPWTAPIAIPSVWALDTVIALNEVRRPTTANATGFYYECTARSGDFKTGGTEPTWGTTLEGTTVDDAVTWTCISLSNADGDYPEHLDDPVIIGSCGQALLIKAEAYVQQAITEIALVNAAADSMATPLADINAALDKVTTYLETGTDDCAKGALAKVTDNIADLRTAIETAVDAMATRLGEVFTLSLDKATTGAEAYLDAGDALIITINDAERVAEKYAQYAQTRAAIANARIASVQMFAQEAATRIANLNSYIAEAGGWTEISNTFVAEATQRVAEVNAWALQADRYNTTSRQYLEIAGRYLASGQAKIIEFLTALGVKAEYLSYKGSSEQFS